MAEGVRLYPPVSNNSCLRGGYGQGCAYNWKYRSELYYVALGHEVFLLYRSVVGLVALSGFVALGVIGFEEWSDRASRVVMPPFGVGRR